METLTRGDIISYRFGPSTYPIAFPTADVRTAVVTATVDQYVEVCGTYDYCDAHWFEVEGDTLVPVERFKHGGEFLRVPSWTPNLMQVATVGRWL